MISYENCISNANNASRNRLPMRNCISRIPYCEMRARTRMRAPQPAKPQRPPDSTLKNHAGSAPPRQDSSTLDPTYLYPKGSGAHFSTTPLGFPKRLPDK